MGFACEFPPREMEDEEVSHREIVTTTAAVGGEDPLSPADATSSSEQQDSLWIETLSEPELDLLINLKELALTMATTAGHSKFAEKKIHLRRLRAIGTVLLETLKEKLGETSVNPNIVDRIALLSDVDFRNNESDPNSEVNEDHNPTPTPIAVHGKRKKMQDDWSQNGEVDQGDKKRKLDDSDFRHQ